MALPAGASVAPRGAATPTLTTTILQLLRDNATGRAPLTQITKEDAGDHGGKVARSAGVRPSSDGRIALAREKSCPVV